MKSLTTSLIAIVFCFAASEASAQWSSDYNAALKAARKTGKPMMVVFRCAP